MFLEIYVEASIASFVRMFDFVAHIKLIWCFHELARELLTVMFRTVNCEVVFLVFCSVYDDFISMVLPLEKS
jgi:hypothetical protein